MNNEKNMCDSCANKHCMLQSNIKRTECDYYDKELEPTDEWLNGYLRGVYNTTKEFKYECEICKAEQESKTGKWIDKDLRKEEYVLVGKCSVCGQVRVKDKFCSNCGARMESEDKE